MRRPRTESYKRLWAKVTDRVPWTMLGLGAGGIWPAVMFISIFTPVMVTGTAPWITEVPPRIDPQRHRRASLDLADDAVTKLRQLAQLRDSGVISEAEFQAKKDDLLNQL